MAEHDDPKGARRLAVIGFVAGVLSIAGTASACGLTGLVMVAGGNLSPGIIIITFGIFAVLSLWALHWLFALLIAIAESLLRIATRRRRARDD